MVNRIIDELASFWREVEPIFRHGVVASSIALVASGLLNLFVRVLPPEDAEQLHQIDHILVVALFWLFGGYTIALLLMRLMRHLYNEYKRGGSEQRALGEPQHKVSTAARNITEGAVQSTLQESSRAQQEID